MSNDMDCLQKRDKLYRVIITVRQQSTNSFSALRSMQGVGQGNLSTNY